MRTFPLAVLLLAASNFFAAAQLTVEVLTDQEQFLRDEPVPVKVRVTNRSGQSLQFGRDNQWLSFAVESQDGAVASRLADAPVQGEFTLDSARMATRTVDLMPCYDLSQPGRYTVTATVRVREWNTEVASKPKRLEVVRGTKIWEQEFGVPSASGAPEARRYVLQQATSQKNLKLYVRIADVSDNKVFRVFPLGPLVSFSRPEAQLDRAGNLHTLFQTGARSFLFSVVNPDGELVIRQTYDYAASRPVLRANDEGRIFVAGGVRRLTREDVPSAVPNNDEPPASVRPGTNSAATVPDAQPSDGKAPRK